MAAQTIINERQRTDIARNRLGPNEEHCPACLYLTTLGWRSEAEITPIGKRFCGNHCRCKIEVRKGVNLLSFLQGTIEDWRPEYQSLPAPMAAAPIPVAQASPAAGAAARTGFAGVFGALGSVGRGVATAARSAFGVAARAAAGAARGALSWIGL